MKQVEDMDVDTAEGFSVGLRMGSCGLYGGRASFRICLESSTPSLENPRAEQLVKLACRIDRCI